MPFVHEYAPISSILQLGGIAGAGTGIAQAKARALQNQLQADAIAKANLDRQQQAEQAYNEEVAKEQANAIQNSLATQRLAQDQNQFNANLEQKKAETNAQNLLAQTGQQQHASEFNQTQKVNEAQQSLAEKKYNEAQTKDTEQEAAVNSMIDNLYPPATNAAENTRLKLQFKATGKLPAPEASNDARNLNALKLVRGTLVDPFTGSALPGKEQDLQNLDAHIATIINSLGNQGAAPESSPLAITPQTAAPVAPVQAGVVQPTGQVTSEGLQIVRVVAQGQPHLYPLVQTAQDYAKLPAKEHYTLPDGRIFIKKG